MRVERARRGLGALIALVLLALAGCGDDDQGRVTQENTGTDTSPSTTTSTTPHDTAPAETETAPPAEPSPDAGVGLPDGHGRGQERPEERPGGAGDEIPASSPAMFTGAGGRITPRTVRVPPFIAVDVRLRSADGATYVLRRGGRTLRASGGRAAAVTFDGLRPGRRLVLGGTGGRVTIEASAEPGP